MAWSFYNSNGELLTRSNDTSLEQPLRVIVPDGVSGDVDTVLSFSGRVVHAWVIKTVGAAVAGDWVQVQTGAAVAVTNQIPLFSDNLLTPCESIADAAYSFVSGATIRVRRNNSGGAGNLACEVYILLQRT
mgnify:FL=1